MAQKSYSTKHHEYRTYSTKGNFDDKNFDSMKAELLPAKYGSLVQSSNGGPGAKEFYYEYKEEKNPAGTYDRKDLHTVEQYDFTNAGDSGYNNYNGSLSMNSPQKLTSTTTVTTNTNRDLSHNIEELDSLLDDLQKDQERKLYKGGYTSDVMETSSFDYKPVTPLKSSGYSSLSRVERDIVSQPANISREVNREIIRNYVTESHVKPVAPQPVPTVICGNCQGHPNVSVGTPMNKVTTTVKTYTYEVPADQDPTTVPIPGTTPPKSAVSEKYLTTDRNYIQENHEHRTYANTHFNTSTPVKQPPPPSPQPGCQYCSHCNSCITTTKTTTSVAGSPTPHHHVPVPPGSDTTKITTRTTNYTTSTQGYPDNKGPVYPANHSPTYAIPVDNSPKSDYPPNQGGPPGPTVYKYTTTNYTTYNTTDGRGKPGPFPAGNLSPPTSPSPFPRTESPAPRSQEPPKRLDELMADFPGHENYHTDHDGLRMRPNPARGPGGSINGNLAVRETAKVQTQSSKGQEIVATPSKNVEGAAVYYPPGHEMFTRKEEALAYQQGGGGYMRAKGKYEYEAESKSKSKSSQSSSKAVVCLPLCCGLPCSIL